MWWEEAAAANRHGDTSCGGGGRRRSVMERVGPPFVLNVTAYLHFAHLYSEKTGERGRGPSLGGGRELEKQLEFHTTLRHLSQVETWKVTL